MSNKKQVGDDQTMETPEELQAGTPDTNRKSKADKQKKKQKKDKKRKRKDDIDEQSENVPTNHQDSNDDAFDEQSPSSPEKATKSKKSKESKEKVKESISSQDNGDDDKEARRQARKQKQLAKKQEKEELLSKVPKVDSDGIAYTKLQIKRMVKRVKQGLDPVPTEQEERERLRNHAKLRKEEEEELAGMLFQRADDDEEDDDDDAEEGEKEDGSENDDDDDDDDDDNMDEASTKAGVTTVVETPAPTPESQRPTKKAKRSKPVPDDYVCQACQNKHQPAHWIYDCPSKVTVKGTNKKVKKERGFNEPDSRKVFVSGLPFDVKPADVQALFKSCGKVELCKLVKFGDTGRCNGQAYVSFDTEQAANKALKLSGTTIDNASEGGAKKKTSKKDAEASKRKELKLKVSKVLNRRFTKNTKT